MSTIEQFESLVRKMNAYNEAVSVLYWDLRTGAPKKSVAGRSEVIGLLSTEVFKMSVSEEMGNYLDSLKNEKASLSLPLQKTIEDVQEDFELQKEFHLKNIKLMSSFVQKQNLSGKKHARKMISIYFNLI